tara:strand:+ start:1809 stop:1982 length:174 start_codon:yes stop_codon:yes gene_type:complete
MPKFKKDKSKFKMKGWSPFTYAEVSDEERNKLWREFMEEQEAKKERLKIHRPKGGAY